MNFNFDYLNLVFSCFSWLLKRRRSLSPRISHSIPGYVAVQYILLYSSCHGCQFWSRFSRFSALCRSSAVPSVTGWCRGRLSLSLLRTRRLILFGSCCQPITLYRIDGLWEAAVNRASRHRGEPVEWTWLPLCVAGLWRETDGCADRFVTRLWGRREVKQVISRRKCDETQGIIVIRGWEMPYRWKYSTRSSLCVSAMLRLNPLAPKLHIPTIVCICIICNYIVISTKTRDLKL